MITRRSFLRRIAAVCVVHAALRWVPEWVEPEPETYTVYVDTWFNVHYESRRRQGIIVPA